MLKRILFALCLVSAVSLRAAPSSLAPVLEAYYEDYFALFPIDAAVNGDNDPRYDAVWPIEIGAEHRAKVAAMATKYLGELAKFDRSQLSANDQLSYDSLKWLLERRLEGTKQIYALLPVNQFSTGGRS